MKGAPHRPNIFIGSSSEQKLVADTLKAHLDQFSECRVWDTTFPLSQSTLDSVTAAINNADFAVFVLSDDDKTIMRDKEVKTSRDNVIFEAGLSIGALSKERTFLVVPSDAGNYHMLSDLNGFTTARYKKESFAKDKMAALGTAAFSIRSAIEDSLWYKLKLRIEAKILIDDNIKTTCKLKVFMTLVNDESFPITCQAGHFSLKDFIVGQGGSSLETYSPEFLLGKYDSQGKMNDVRGPIINLAPKKHTTFFVPIEVKSGMKLIGRNFLSHKCGKFQLSCLLHRDQIDTFRYELEITTSKIENLTEKLFSIDDLVGKWLNNWEGGQEKVEITSDLTYYINGQSVPSFEITKFTNTRNNIEFTKRSVGSLPTFENQLTLVDENTLIGSETNAGKPSHNIRYTRIM